MDQVVDVKLLLNFGMSFCAVVISFYLLIAAVIGGNLNKKINRYFLIMVIFNLIESVNNFIWGFFINLNIDTSKTIFYSLTYIGFIAPGFQTFVFSLYIYENLKRKTEIPRKINYIAGIFCLAHTIIITLGLLYNKLVLYENDIFILEDSFWLGFAFTTLSLLAYLAVTLKYIKSFHERERIAILLYILTPLIFNTLDRVYTDIYIGDFFSAFTMFIIYISIQVELKWQMENKETELTENRIAIMLSQIQPHFMYNSLNAISNLCYENPEANKALLSFSSYLRTNMDSLTERELILFEKELKHTECYLYLEKLRFENRLNIVYDIRTTDFVLPTLTLQPIAENAVRHGVSKKEEGGTVTIRTEECSDKYLIKVIDDGVGFDYENLPTENSGHVGLLNVKERLLSMCNGNIIIEGTMGKGTTVIIEIPKGE